MTTADITPTEHKHELRANGVSGIGSIVMAVAGSAPAYSISATTGLLIAAAGLGAPAALLWCGLAMVGIAFAFSYLGRADVNAGATYSWVGRALHPALGFLSGWSLVISATIFMVAATVPAGTATLQIIAPSQTGNTPLVVAIAAVWFIVMAVCVMIGVTVTAKAQWIMSSIEVGILAVFAIIGIVKGLAGLHTAGVAFSWTWFGFGSFSGISGGATPFVGAALLAAFYYWGWDVSSNLGEETKNGKKASGLGGIVGVVIVFLLIEAFTVISQVLVSGHVITTDTNNNPIQLMVDLGQAIIPGVGGDILLIAVALSTIATLETTLIQVTRTLFAMGRDNTLPKFFGTTHRQWKTPAIATIVVTLVSLVLFVIAAFQPNVNTVMTDAVYSIDFQIAFYYALAGAAVVIAYRKHIFTSVASFFFIGLWPAVGAVFMGWMFVEYIQPNLGTPIVIYLGIGGIVIGIIPMLIWWRKAPRYYSRRPLETEEEITPATTPITINAHIE